jgi:hypothetical protein
MAALGRKRRIGQRAEVVLRHNAIVFASNQENPMRFVFSVVVATTLTLSATTLHAQLAMSASGGRSDCGGNSVNVIDGTGELDLTGDCNKVSIVASGVEVYIAKANVVEIIGDNTTVTVETRLKELYAVGSGNTVILADVESVHVNGDRNRIDATTAVQVGGVGTGNTVRWREGDPVVEFPVPGNTYGKTR